MTAIFDSVFQFSSERVSVLFLLMFFINVHFLSGQDFTSSKDGAWKDNQTWTNNTNCGQYDNISQGQPPISKNWGCVVNVVIGHDVVYNGNASGFGSGMFSGIRITAGGSLLFEGDLTINGGGSLPIIELEEGAELRVNGSFDINRGVEIIVPKNARLIVDRLIVGDNQPKITIAEGGTLIVKDETILKSKATLNLEGDFETNDLTFTSGGTINASSNSGKFNVSGDLLIQNGTLNMLGSSRIQVNGTSSTGQSGQINFKNTASGLFSGDVSMTNGGGISAENNSGFTFEENLTMSGGATIELSNFASGIIQNDVIMTNGTINVSNNTDISVGGKLNASNGARINGKNNGSIYLCDYPNSTKANSSHVNLKNNSFYGQGCFALPVVWKSFELFLAEDEIIKLEWKTSKEEANSHYEIERSLGGIDSFEKIGEVTAAGWTNAETRYTFEDNQQILFSGMVYYRIRQVDFNGNSTVSDVVGSRVHRETAEKIEWSAYPNPSDGTSLKVKLLSGSVSGTVKARFLQTTSEATFEGEVGMELDQWLQSRIREAVKGVCVLELAFEEEVYRIKVVRL
ncbi:fibronectin type III domain-containing protein [Cyclobacterium plantarum]|uniref:Uncharacterized protein n=1 Tax=Cyclobacterium plantarum TaxID=2716263 RepID=A0ABX0H489_9BACT|nr:hypothetical protein [Cyclobacterium plantarum]NHE55203.1 hypothetical protein [Cyclobacterium plantarum]